MSNNPWERRRNRQVDWGRYVREDSDQADQVLWTLMGLNVFVFLLWRLGGDVGQLLMRTHFTVSRDWVVSHPWTLLTAAFSQYSLGHLFANLLAMWVFGREVGHALGARRLLLLYLGGGLVSSLCHVLLTPGAALGASGAVMALAVLFGALFPDRVIYFNFLVPIPARMLVALYIGLDLFGFLGGGGSGIDHAGHLGGAAFGLLFWAVQYGRRRR